MNLPIPANQLSHLQLLQQSQALLQEHKSANEHLKQEIESLKHQLAWFKQQLDRKTLKRINKLITECLRDPFNGIGKPEPLKGNWQGFWSRRISNEHRLVYQATGTRLTIAACRFHF